MAIDLSELYTTPDALADFLMLPDADQRRILAERAASGDLRGATMSCSIAGGKNDGRSGGVIRCDMSGSGAI